MANAISSWLVWLLAIVLFGPTLLAGLIGLAISIYSLANDTRIDVDKQTLAITHGPLPFPLIRNVSLPSPQIKQLYVKQFELKHGNSPRNCALFAITQDDEIVHLLGNLRVETAIFLEEKIESFLKIENYPVAGELTR